MTWGQLRFQLQTSAPEVSLDLLDEYLNNRYQQVLGKTDWTGLNYRTIVQTQAAYQSTTDTATFTVGSTTVTGLGTSWSSGLIGKRMYRTGDSVFYTVAAVPSGTSLTLDRAYEGVGIDASGTVYATAGYVFMQHIYALPADVKNVISVLGPASPDPIDKMSKDLLDQSVGPRTNLGDPMIFAPIEDTPESAPPVYSQIEFYPPPLRSRGMTVRYVHKATPFDGQSTSGSPVPFVTDLVLLSGAKADIQTKLENYAGALKYEADFDKELNRMLQEEFARRRAIEPVKMADKYTRHRVARYTRGQRASWGIGQGGPQ